MKNLILLSGLLMSFAAHSFENADKTYPLTSSDIKVSSLCPVGAQCFVGGQQVDILFTMRGCLDRLGQVKYTSKQVANGVVLSVYAEGIEGKKATCIVANRINYNIPLPGMIGKVKVNFLKKKEQI